MFPNNLLLLFIFSANKAYVILKQKVLGIIGYTNTK